MRVGYATQQKINNRDVGHIPRQGGGAAVSVNLGVPSTTDRSSTPVVVARYKLIQMRTRDHILERADAYHFHAIDLRKTPFIISLIF
jgi:hypothetical protein